MAELKTVTTTIEMRTAFVRHSFDAFWEKRNDFICTLLRVIFYKLLTHLRSDHDFEYVMGKH